MKIAIYHELPIKSGSRRSLNNIAKILKKKNQVDLYLVGEENNKEENKFFTNIYFHRFVQKKWLGKNWKTRLYRDTLELYNLYKLNKKVAKKINQGQYDICFIHGSKFTESPFILRFIKNTPKIYYAHASNYALVFESVVGIPRVDIFRYWYEKLNRLIRKQLDLKNVKDADLILANSKFTQKEIEKIYCRKSTLAYLGVNKKIFKPTDTQKKYDLLFIGSYQRVDGFYILENALELLENKPKTRIVAIEKEWIQKEEDLSKLYNSAKLVICLAHNEPFGLTPLEAMSCGVPVIAVNEGGYKETVDNNKSGILIKRDSKELADKISFLLKHPEQIKKMGKYARIVIEDKWTWDKRVFYLEKIFKKFSVI